MSNFNKVKTRLDSDDRAMIELLHNQQEFSQEEIAEKVKASQSTISREFARGTFKDVYHAKRAHLACSKAMSKRKGKAYKIEGDVEEKVIRLLERRFSSRQISVVLRKEDDVKVSRVAVYGFIRRDESLGGTLYKCLRRGGGRGRRLRGKSRFKIPNRTDISERPNVINTRGRFGDWECGLIEGSTHSGFFLSLLERKSRFGTLKLLRTKKNEVVAEAIGSALEHYLVHTITGLRARSLNLQRTERPFVEHSTNVSPGGAILFSHKKNLFPQKIYFPSHRNGCDT